MSNNSSSGSSSIIHGIGFLFHTNKFQQHQQQTVSRTLISHAQVKHHNLSAVLNGWCSITNRSISIPFLYNSISFHFALSENNSLVLFTNWHSDRSNERLNEWTSRHMNETIERSNQQSCNCFISYGINFVTSVFNFHSIRPLYGQTKQIDFGNTPTNSNIHIRATEFQNKRRRRNKKECDQAKEESKEFSWVKNFACPI